MTRDMFNTSIGPFDGKSWEDILQLVFKQKFSAEGYQQVVATPGDFGLEGFTLKTGLAFQCYCPDKNHPAKELHEIQRDKITRDLNKLRDYEGEIKKRIGETQLRVWIFVTPTIAKNELLAHARAKEQEVRAWNLSTLTDDFTVMLCDLQHFLVEINQMRSATGKAMLFDDSSPELSPLDQLPEYYETNIRRKCVLRLAPKVSVDNYQSLLERLNGISVEAFLKADAYFREIEEKAPTVYFSLVRLINEYEHYVGETGIAWTGSAEDLTDHVRVGLASRISSELSPDIDETTASKISRLVVSRWMAICQLDYE
ncbi:hypothetical protein [Lysobacter capsici]|uniref:hypothetical protein n=2 Tax=Lysobacter capsici TaxID=435897 RepID=UPI00287B739C|nr:hypothetical protein [Lysobacter capsici]WND81305.1 hypothetical protein RJ610_02700 [Lysobacter capsici]